MYSTFNQGKDRWDDETVGRSSGSSGPARAQLVPGRFRLHQVQVTAQPSFEQLRPVTSFSQSSSASPSGHHERPAERTWLLLDLQPNKARIARLTDSWLARWSYLTLYPALLVWAWIAVPFPHSYRQLSSPGHSTPGAHQGPDEKQWELDADFTFFLLWFFGGYVCASLLFVTSLFNLFRVNWWPRALGGKISYASFWALTLSLGALIHHYDLFGVRNRWQNKTGDDSDVDDVGRDWERKSVWTGLAVICMSLPAFACFIKIRKDRRQTFRHSLTLTQRTFLERQLTKRIPRSYKRFVWFLVCILIALFTLTAGQSFSSVYLSTLPHSSLDGLAYVWSWMGTVQLLHSLTSVVLESKVRSKALLSVFRYYYYLTEFIFVRTLFARLRSPDQFVTIQAASTLWVVLFQPAVMSKPVHWIMQRCGYDKPYDLHCNLMAISYYLRNLASNTTMVCFLGYLTILHFGPNRDLFPFFRLDHPTPEDPYNYRLTAIASAGIWASELLSAFLARQLCYFVHSVDVTNAGLNEIRNYPELMPALCWCSIHVLSDILLFLVKLTFR